MHDVPGGVVAAQQAVANFARLFADAGSLIEHGFPFLVVFDFVNDEDVMRHGISACHQ
jgi:hypothetical protein